MNRTAFWHAQHMSASRFWLTGSSLPEVLAAYDIAPPVDLEVTEVGVGLRYMTRALVEHNRVTGVDIVESALAPARAYATTLLVDEIQKAAPADLAFCHLVFQHCDSKMVSKILRDTPLKPEGMFAVQTAYLLEKDDGNWDHLKIVWHPREEIIQLAADAGLVPFWERTAETMFDGARIGSTCFKCRRIK